MVRSTDLAKIFDLWVDCRGGYYHPIYPHFSHLLSINFYSFHIHFFPFVSYTFFPFVSYTFFSIHPFCIHPNFIFVINLHFPLPL